MASLPINLFDAAVDICLFLAVVLGFMSGLLRSLATIFGYLAAMGIVVAAAPHLTPGIAARFNLPSEQVAGALLGAVRAGLLAVALVLLFDRIIPPSLEPAFLNGSHWRPALSRAGQQGLHSLPPGVADYIDRLKRARGI